MKLESLVPELSCPVCQDVFSHVVETPCCFQGYCLECLSAVFSHSGPCPSCRAPIALSDCRPNVMVQRLVDGLPAPCPNGKCPAKLTRGIVQEHLTTCHFQLTDCPNSAKCGKFERRALGIHVAICEFQERPECPLHQMELSLRCQFDGDRVCPKCALIGQHRTHQCLPWTSLQIATLQATAVSLETSLPISSSAGYWIFQTRQRLAALQAEIHKDDGLPALLDPNRSLAPHQSEPWDDHHVATMYSLAVLLCEDRLTHGAVEAVLREVGVKMPDPELVKVFIRAMDPSVSGSLLAPSPASSSSSSSSSSFTSSSSSRGLPLSSAHLGAGVVQTDLELELELLKQNFKDMFDFQGIRLHTSTLTPHVKTGERNRMHVLFEVLSGTPAAETENNRLPISLVIILDCSGSMAGSKLKHCKDAIKMCLRRLGPQDFIHLVSYSDLAKTEFCNGTRDQAGELESIVDSLRATGGTNICCGLEEGIEVLRKMTPGPGYSKRMFLFSDGVATTRVHEIQPLTASLKDQDVFTSAFGIGADFDERMMKGIADHGSGNYFFISSTESIAGIVEKGMRGIERVMATEPVLHITGCQGQPVLQVGGGNHGDNNGVFRIGDLREKGLKQLLVELDWDGAAESPSGAAGKGGEIPLVTYELRYKLGGIEPMTMQGSVKVIPTDDWAVFGGEVDGGVEVQLVIHEVSQLDKQGLQAASTGNTREALRLKRMSKAALERVKEKDRFGFVPALLGRCNQRIGDLERTVASGARGNSALLLKELHRDQLEEEDGDMGFGLFD